MPLKNKGKKGEAKGQDQEKNETKPSEREILLSQQLETLTKDLTQMKRDVDQLRKENESLQEEAQQTRQESHEYMAYMARKTQKRQTAIISLNDNNQEELKRIQRQNEEMISHYEQIKNELKDEMLEKESELAAAEKELTDLEHYQRLQKNQEAEIKSLEDEVQHIRSKHAETIQKLKAQFLLEKKQFQGQSDAKSETMARQASMEVKQSMLLQTERVKDENKELRKELLALIQRTRSLHKKRSALEEQRKTVKGDLKFGKDITKIQGTRTNILYKSFAP